MARINIEVLYPEVCNQNGDLFNVRFLEDSIKDFEVNVYYTFLDEKPKFADGDIDLIYIGNMSEKYQEKVIKALSKYVNKLKQYINDNKILISTGNSIEIFGKYIENEDKSKIEGLNLTDLYAKRQMMNRINYNVLGKYKDDIKIVGFRSSFSQTYRR